MSRVSARTPGRARWWGSIMSASMGPVRGRAHRSQKAEAPRTAEEECRRLGYERAVEAGEIDPESRAWYAATRRHTAALWRRG